MRRDICLYYEKELPEVFSAYVEAINKRFGKDCNPAPYHTIQFALSFSFKYNMNGGGCTVRLMPHGRGTAVNVRYSIAQAVGARYEAHCRDLTNFVESILRVNAMPATLLVEEFLCPENQVTPNSARPAQPKPTPQPTPTGAQSAQKIVDSVVRPAAPAPQPVPASQPAPTPTSAQTAQKIVETVVRPTAPAPQTTAAPAPQPAAAPKTDADAVVAEIRKYKVLLDEGILTEEEFTLKKKQLLGI